MTSFHRCWPLFNDRSTRCQDYACHGFCPGRRPRRVAQRWRPSSSSPKRIHKQGRRPYLDTTCLILSLKNHLSCSNSVTSRMLSVEMPPVDQAVSWMEVSWFVFGQRGNSVALVLQQDSRRAIVSQNVSGQHEPIMLLLLGEETCRLRSKSRRLSCGLSSHLTMMVKRKRVDCDVLYPVVVMSKHSRPYTMQLDIVAQARPRNYSPH